MSLFVKVCGVRDIRTAQVCVAAGVDAIGFVFARSPRQIAPTLARAIADVVRGEIKVVAVFNDPGPIEIKEIDRILAPDLIQADQQNLFSIPMDKRLPVLREGEDAQVPSGLFLYEGPVSGVGQVVDLASAAEMSARGQLLLAGGLSPTNVAGAIELVRPAGVDVSSGVETTPGIKDHKLIEVFAAAARTPRRSGAPV